MGARENKLQKFQISHNDDFTLVFSIPVKFEIYSSGSRKKLYLVLLQIINCIYSLWEMLKRMRYGLKYSGTRFLSTEN